MTITREQVVQWALGSGFSIGIEQVFAVDGPTQVQCTFGLEQFATLARADLEAENTTLNQECVALIKHIAQLHDQIRDTANDLSSTSDIIAQQAAHIEQLKSMLIRLDGWLGDRNLCGLMPDELAALAIPTRADILRERDARLVESIAGEFSGIVWGKLQYIANQLRKGTFNMKGRS